ncbi:hypothetical protein [Nocardia nova]|uniref:hypothetical protein n=1 Tax=Nocardia nova TaxID=37330 RepID=UPI0021584889|nr:hypothetical protein [Nocardia nova]
MVGDAGYCASPLSGQGADLSLVGAYVLAAELAAARDDHRAASRATRTGCARWSTPVKSSPRASVPGTRRVPGR